MKHRTPIRLALLVSAALAIAACQVTGLGPANDLRTQGVVSEP